MLPVSTIRPLQLQRVGNATARLCGNAIFKIEDKFVQCKSIIKHL